MTQLNQLLETIQKSLKGFGLQDSNCKLLKFEVLNNGDMIFIVSHYSIDKNKWFNVFKVWKDSTNHQHIAKRGDFLFPQDALKEYDYFKNGGR